MPPSDGSVGRQASPSHATTERITTRPQSKKHTELSENQTVWKSNQQEFEEAAFIQRGRRDGDVETGGQARRCGVLWRGGGRMGGPTFTCGG